MAFLVTEPVQTAIGVPVSNTHWRWDGMYVSPRKPREIHCVIKGWTSREACFADATPVGEKTFVLTGQDFLDAATLLETPNASPGLSAVIYEKARLLEPLFTNAQDVE